MHRENCMRSRDRGLACEERSRRRDKRCGLLAEDWPVAAVRHDAERRIRNPAKLFDGLLDRIERIAIAVLDQSSCGDLREGRRGEVHVVAIVGKLARVAP